MKKESEENLTNIQNKTTIKVSQELRSKLAEIGNKDETFEDVIWRLIRRAEPERSGEIVTSKSSVIQYKRKKEFVELSLGVHTEQRMMGNEKGMQVISERAGFEYEYNIPPKKEGEWELDIRIVKVYYNQKTYNPSEFFGVDNENKCSSPAFIQIYLNIISNIFIKEFGITKLKNFGKKQILQTLEWRRVYYENKLSEESFISDVEDILRKFSERQIESKTRKLLENSVVGRLNAKFPISPYLY